MYSGVESILETQCTLIGKQKGPSNDLLIIFCFRARKKRRMYTAYTVVWVTGKHHRDPQPHSTQLKVREHPAVQPKNQVMWHSYTTTSNLPEQLLMLERFASFISPLFLCYSEVGQQKKSESFVSSQTTHHVDQSIASVLHGKGHN